MKRTTFAAVALRTMGVVAVSAALLACGTPSDGTGEPSGTTGEEILGGSAVEGHAFDAIATLSYESPAHGAQTRFECNAVLISPWTAVTSVECATPIAATGQPEFLDLGPDAAHPREWAEAIDVAIGPGGLGISLAVLFLKDAVSDVSPLRLKTLTDADVGQSLFVVGYGEQTPRGEGRGTRSEGGVTLRSLSHGGSGRRVGYQATVRGAQPCHGDEGGALVGWVGGDLVLYGITALSKDDPTCAGGPVFSIFDPEVLSFLERAQAWMPGEPTGGILEARRH